MASIESKGYARPEVLVDADWVEQHINDPKVKLVEVDVDTNAYDEALDDFGNDPNDFM